jgi:hypothetical protein
MRLHDRILVVCEGGKTEPNYLKEVRAEYRLSSTSIRIIPCARGTALIQIVEDAESRCRDEKIYDRAYCVFDKDDHQTYSAAVQKARALDLKMRNDVRELVSFSAVTSVPCFELWLLLHFENVTREEHRDKVRSSLQAHYPEYSKGAKGTFAFTRDRLRVAYENASYLREQRGRTGQDNPGTEMDILTRYLIEIGQEHLEMIQ